MSRFAVILPFAGFEQMAQNQWICALRKLGHAVQVHYLRAVNVAPAADLPRLVAAVLKSAPAAIFAGGATGFAMGCDPPGFFLDPRIQQIPVVVFWFDDPYRAVEYRKGRKGFLDLLRLPNVQHLVWDGYWRKWLAEAHGVRSWPIHLAADPDEFRPLPRRPDFCEHVVFIGTLASPVHLEREQASLPPVLQRVAGEVATAIAGAPYARLPYAILDAVIQESPRKIAAAFQTFCEKDPAAVLRLRSMAWKLGKNEVRKRVLRAALQVAPVLILAGNFEQTHASEAEIRSLLRVPADKLVVRDTRDMTEAELGNLYAYGRLHIQATDPQSVDGGIPFRVFQTAACRRPLLTDKKPELGECFEYGKELLTFESELDFAGVLQDALREPVRLEEIAQRGYERFLREHTWRHRVEQVLAGLRSDRGGGVGAQI